MYEYIKGTIETLTPTSVVVETAGIGYLLNISLQTYTQINGKPEVTLYTHFIVREDAQLLYGFSSRGERDIFRLLTTVSGIGAATARMILSTFAPDEVTSIILAGKAELLKSVKGLGIKSAQKIIVELRDKVGSVATGDVALSVAAVDSDTYNEALAALTMLGFAKAASDKVLRGMIKDHPTSGVEELVRAALKKL